MGNSRRAFGFALLGELFAVFLTIGLYFGGADDGVFPMNWGPTWSYARHGSTVDERDVAWHSMVNDQSNTMFGHNLPEQATRSLEFSSEAIEVIYSGACLTRNNLASMRQFEEAVLAEPGYQRLCQLQGSVGNTSCRKPRSVLRFFDGTYETEFPVRRDTGEPVFAGDPNFDRIEDIMKIAFQATGDSEIKEIKDALNPNIRVIHDYVVGSTFNKDAPHLNQHCRTMFYVGYPVSEDFINIQDQLSLQTTRIRAAQALNLKSFFEQRDRVGSTEMLYMSPGLFQDGYDDAVAHSSMLLIGAAVVIIVGMVAATKSLILTIGWVVGTVASYFWANLMYRYIFGFRYFGWPQALSSYILVLISIVDMLLFLEHWRDAKDTDRAIHEMEELLRVDDELGHDLESKDSLVADYKLSKLVIAYCKTVSSVKVASIISTAAFFAQCFADTKMIVATGLFCGLLVITNFLTFYVYTPCLLLYWNSITKCKTPVWLTSTGKSRAHMKRFVRRLWKHVVGHPWIRWLLLSVISVVVCIFIILATKKTDISALQPGIWEETNNFGKFTSLAASSFGHSDRGKQTRVVIVWGLDSGFDRTQQYTPVGSHEPIDGCHEYDFDCTGNEHGAAYDKAFDITSAQAQTQLYKFCENMRKLSGYDVQNLRIQRSITGPVANTCSVADPGCRPLEIKCFAEDEKAFYAAGQAGVPGFPFEFVNMKTIMTSYSDAYPASVYSAASFNPPLANDASAPSCNYCDTYYRSSEFGILNWLSNNGNTDSEHSADLTKYVGLIGGTADPNIIRNTTSGKQFYAGNYGSRLRYVAIEVNLTTHAESLDSEEGIRLLNAWDKYIKENTKALVKPLRNPFQTTPFDRTWSWMKLKEILASDLAQGQVIAGVFCFVFLAIAVNNVGVAGLAIFSILCAGVMSLGIMASLDWQIGMAEVIIMCGFVSVSSEFVVHYAVHYITSGHFSRETRAEWAMEEAGYATATGGILTLASVLFCLGSKLKFQYEFGVMFAGLVGLGLVTGPILFVILAGITGPEEFQGTWLPKKLVRFSVTGVPHNHYIIAAKRRAALIKMKRAALQVMAVNAFSAAKKNNAKEAASLTVVTTQAAPPSAPTTMPPVSAGGISRKIPGGFLNKVLSNSKAPSVAKSIDTASVASADSADPFAGVTKITKVASAPDEPPSGSLT